jgi:carbonic anhydrase/acetyltransferase-like protein (isoleucine patch superfamily)
MQCADWNAVRIGKDCVMDGILQLHSFENMMLKVKRSEIEDGCAVGFGSTVMGGAHIGRETTLLPLSLVLKEMSLPTAIYHGSPVEPINLDGQAHACPTSNA